MANKKNLPNIPIYIGDWERDCNVLSLESEAAWMRIVFKLWTSGKQNSIKMPTKSIQNLWRCSSEKMFEILDDLIYNNICEVNKDGNFVEFTCRRFVKENSISEIRSDASKGIKNKQKPNKPKAKHKQNTDYDNENDYEVIIEKGVKGEKLKYDENVTMLENEYQTLIDKFGEQATKWMIDKLNNYKTSKGKTYKSDYRAILSWVVDEYNLKNKHNEPTINRQTPSTINQNLTGWGD